MMVRTSEQRRTLGVACMEDRVDDRNLSSKPDETTAGEAQPGPTNEREGRQPTNRSWLLSPCKAPG